MEKKALHIPIAYVELEVRDKNSKLLKKYEQPAHSWVKNFMNIIRYSFADKDIPVTKQDGSNDTIPSNAEINLTLIATGGSGNDNYGILVGTGTKAFDVNDYSLDNKIPHGTDSGQLSYGSTNVDDLVDDGSKLSFKIVRTFNNNSGADITVKEVGLAIRGYGKNILIARDVLDNPVTVPNGSTLTVRYIIQYQYA